MNFAFHNQLFTLLLEHNHLTSCSLLYWSYFVIKPIIKIINLTIPPRGISDHSLYYDNLLDLLQFPSQLMFSSISVKFAIPTISCRTFPPSIQSSKISDSLPFTFNTCPISCQFFILLKYYIVIRILPLPLQVSKSNKCLSLPITIRSRSPFRYKT